MKQTYKEFALLASDYTASKTNLAEAKETTTSLSNELAWVAVAIALNGSKEDKASLKESIAKDKPFHSLRGMVSKANAVAFHLLTHESIELKESIVTLEAIKEVPEDSIPSVTVNELYKVVNDATKQDTDVLARKKAIEKQALQQASDHIGVDISKKQFALMPSERQEVFIAEATAIVDADIAAKSKAKEQETRQEAIERILAEIASLGCEAEVMEALTAPASQVA